MTAWTGLARKHRPSWAAPCLALLLGCAGEQASSPLAVPDVEFSLDVQSLPVAPGTACTFTLKAHPLLGFRGPVDLSVEAPAPGLEISVAPARLVINAGDVAATIQVKVPESATAGDRSLILHLVGSFGPRDLPFKVTVLPARLLPVSTFLNYTPANLAIMAFKDGDRPWRLLNGNGGEYSAAITDPAGRYGLAYGYTCTIGTFRAFQMNYIFETLQESGSLGIYFICDPPPGPGSTLYSLQGSLHGPGSGYLVSSASALRFEGGADSYLLQVVKGKGDLAGWTFTDPATEFPTRFFLDRGRDAQGNARRDVDFSTEGFDPGPAQAITYGPVGGAETLQGTVRYFTAGGQFLDLANGLAPPAYAAFPSDRSQSGDSYAYAFGAFGPSHSEIVYGGSQGLPGALDVRFPSVVEPYQVAWLKDPYLRPAITWTSVSPEPHLQQFAFNQSSGQEQVYWYLLFSAGWLGSGAHHLDLPDLSGLAGWDGAWAFRPGKSVTVDHGQSGAMGTSAAQAQGSTLSPLHQPLPMLWRPALSNRGLRLESEEVGGQRHGAFRVVGLPATRSPNSYSVTRQVLSTP